jgi:acetylornithine deacetylase/succinyl-diaminopimelate desuccinylase-like protein
MIRTLTAVLLASAALAAPAAAQTYPGQAEFRDLYRELVETNTTLSSGSCLAAEQKMAARLKAAGYADGDIAFYAPAERPKDAAMIVLLPGADPKLKPILLMAHVDVVEANRADWERDPFKLVEENGYFYARGADDDKAMAAEMTDAMIRYKKEGFKPRRGLKLALTCGEETFSTFNSTDWLLKTQPAVLDAAFALNEGGTGLVDGDKRIYVGIQAGEKIPQTYTLTVTNPGGHSSQPTKTNAIYQMSAALIRIGGYDFPIKLNEATRLHFQRMGPTLGGERGADMLAALKPGASPEVFARIAQDKGYNSMMRTTCVATMINGGHAVNALPQKVEAQVNCRILPGETVEQTQGALTKLIADPQITIAPLEKPSPTAAPPPLSAAILGPAEQVAKQMWPGLPLIPAMATGATDSRFLLAAGIPSYGLSGNLREVVNGTHGLNERIRVRSLYEGREFLYRVIKLYASAQ